MFNLKIIEQRRRLNFETQTLSEGKREQTIVCLLENWIVQKEILALRRIIFE